MSFQVNVRLEGEPEVLFRNRAHNTCNVEAFHIESVAWLFATSATPRERELHAGPRRDCVQWNRVDMEAIGREPAHPE